MAPPDLDNIFRPLVLKDLRGMCRARGLNPAGGKEQLVDRIKQHMITTNNYSVVIPQEGAADGLPAVAPSNYQAALNPLSGGYGQQQSHAMAPPGGHSQIQLGGYSNEYQLPPQRPPGYGTPGQAVSSAVYGATSEMVKTGPLSNNYARPGGQQNVGNFITDRPSSRVLAPPGGASQISFGDYTPPPKAPVSTPPSASYSAPYQQQPQAQQYGGYGSAAPQSYGSYTASPGQAAPQQYGGYGGAQPAAAFTQSPSFGERGGQQTNNYARPGGQQNVGNFITDRPSSRVLAPPGGRSQISFG